MVLRAMPLAHIGDRDLNSPKMHFPAPQTDSLRDHANRARGQLPDAFPELGLLMRVDGVWMEIDSNVTQYRVKKGCMSEVIECQ